MNELVSIKDWLGVISLIVALGGTVYAWLTSRSAVNGQAIVTIQEKQGLHENRIRDLENELRHLPAKDDVNQLKLAIAQMAGTIGKLETTIDSVSEKMNNFSQVVAKSVGRIEDYMLKSRDN